MSTHPNVILKCTIKAQGTTRNLLRDLLARNREELPDESLPLWRNGKGDVVTNINGQPMKISRSEDEVTIGEASYHTLPMEEDYDEGWQISGEEGDLVVFDYVTYGYGEEISWQELRRRVESVEQWATRQGLEYKIAITANYW